MLQSKLIATLKPALELNLICPVAVLCGKWWAGARARIERATAVAVTSVFGRRELPISASCLFCV
jgi:hypothetical protein